jgi:hypothetical protein
MPRKPSAKTTKLLPTAPALPLPQKKSIVGGILYIIWLLFKWAFVFNSETCINPLTWAIAMVLRGLIFYLVLFPYEDKIFSYFTLADGHTSIFFLPVGLFFLWYFFTSFLMFYGALKTGFGRISTTNEGRYSEFEKLADYANNKMKFQSYQDSMDMLTGRKDKK